MVYDMFYDNYNVRLKVWCASLRIISLQVGESVYHTDRWVPPSSEELFNLRPREEFIHKRYGFQWYV